MRLERAHHAPRRPRLLLAPLLTIATLLSFSLLPSSARATFHLIEINKIMTSYNGDPAIQAVELRMIAGGQNQLTGTTIRSYDAAGVFLATHGTFPGVTPAAGAVADRKLLCATSGFASTFGITPDLVITAGLPLSTGQVAFENVGCLINAVAYGDVTVPKNGTTSAAAIPSGLAYVLARTINNTTSPSCPLGENAGARFAIRSGSTGAPVAFSNNAGATVNVTSTVTDAGDVPPVAPAPRAYPNPFRASIQIESAAANWVGVFDVRGSLLRVVHRASGGSTLFRGEWDGRDANGKMAPAGIYFIRFGREPGAATKRVALLR